MPRAVGLDVGSKTAKLVELSGSAKSFKVQRFVVRPMPPADGEAAVEARAAVVREMFAQAKAPKDDVCATFDAGSTIFREIQVPFREDDKIEKTIRFEAENHIHGRAIEDVVVNWTRTGFTKDGSQVIIFAAPKAGLGAHLSMLERAGIEPASVDLDATAVFTACEAAGVFRETPTVVVLEIGARTTNLVVVDQGQLRAVRSFLVGVESVGAAIGSDLDLPEGEGQRRALAPGANDPAALLVPARESKETAKSAARLEQDAGEARRDEFVRKIQRELLRSLSSIRTETPPSKVLIAGGGSLLPGIAEALSQRLSLPVEPLSLLSRLGGWRPSGEDAAYQEAVAPAAVGCALRLLGVDPLGVELRQEEFAPSNTFDVVKGALALAVTLLVLVLGGLFWTTNEERVAEIDAYLSSRTSVASRAATIYQDVEVRYRQEIDNKDEKTARAGAKAALDSVPNDENYLNVVRGRLTARYAKLEDDLGLSKDVPPIESASKVWKEIVAALNAVPRDEFGWFAITGLTVRQNEASIKIEVGDQSTVDKVVGALSANEYLKSRARTAGKFINIESFNLNQDKRHAGSIQILFTEDR